MARSGKIIRRLLILLLLIAALGAGGFWALSASGIEVPSDVDASRLTAWFEQLTSHSHSQSPASAEAHSESSHSEQFTILATTPKVMDVVLPQPYVCQIHARRHIEIRAMVSGYLQEILIQEGQAVKKGDTLFKILPVIYQAKLDAEKAEAQLAELEYNYTKTLAAKNAVSENEVKLLAAKLAKAKARVDLAQAELNFTNVVAPFDGIVDRLQEQIGSLITEGDVLTTLSDNSVMWVYFNVPEAQYLQYMADENQHKAHQEVLLKLADGSLFAHPGKIAAIEAKFNNQTGNIPFRADFPNPDGLLRHGQTGTVLINRIRENALVIPQRATFEILDKTYVYVIDDQSVAHQRLIRVENEKDDIFLISNGLKPDERFVLEGINHVHDGEPVEYTLQDPDEVLAHLKFHAE
ncbi:MAG: hypothetical protein KatS3mg108_3662 [Isosphaeraceae bacterium]|jgi:membrane fusion protein (multidrug efflux system)|nr:MAG: hypothetical protein KatS3mg108_3662 [Isosphaeraceae bacterium]